MNTYNTFCEETGCDASIIQRAESFEGAISNILDAGWYARERDRYGYESYCPEHAQDQIDRDNLRAELHATRRAESGYAQ